MRKPYVCKTRPKTLNEQQLALYGLIKWGLWSLLLIGCLLSIGLLMGCARVEPSPLMEDRVLLLKDLNCSCPALTEKEISAFVVVGKKKFYELVEISAECLARKKMEHVQPQN